MVDKLHHQLVGNAGLYFVCFELSKRGWNALPTSRNAKGVDIVIYNHDASKTHTIQVKSLSKKNDVPLGSNTDNLIADYMIICRKVSEPIPEIFIVKTKKMFKDDLITMNTNKEGVDSYWFWQKDYEQFKDNWKEIGNG